MTLHRMFDASRPPAKPYPGCDAVAGYIGGMTPHVWSLAEWQRFSHLRQLPIWVYGHAVSAVDQARAAAKAAVALGWKADLPAGTLKHRRVIVLDMETTVNNPFVTAFANNLHLEGFGCWPYGSESTIFQNPPADGYWVAQYPGGGPVISYPGEHVVAHQYAANLAFDGTAVDLSVITAAAVEHLGRGPRHTP